MNFQELLTNRLIKPKERTEALSHWLSDHPKEIGDLIAFAKTSKDPVKATCIEAIEFATKKDPKIITKAAFDFICQSLTEKTPRIKWESARVIGNTAAQFPKQLEAAITNLLLNTEHSGTVVRWSAAFALGEIIKLRTPHNNTLIPALESVCEREEKNSIKKIYIAAIKKTKQ